MASAVGAAYLFYIRPHPGLLPSVFAALRRDRAEAKGEGGQEKENRSPPLWEYRRRDRPDDRSITSKQTQVAPSPWGEGRGEGGRDKITIEIEKSSGRKGNGEIQSQT
jgi:hypothetical protein